MSKRIYIAGDTGMVGSALTRRLAQDHSIELVTRSSKDLNLCEQADVRAFFAQHKIDEVYLAAARVGGIHANNSYPADFIYQNLMIEANVIHEAWGSGVKKLMFLGSSCIYPRNVTQPMAEDALLTGVLEPTNEPYALAKISGIKLCESYNRQHGTDFRSVMPTNLYGPGDNYHPENSHVIPAMLRRFHQAKESGANSVTIWGSGNPMREFLHVDDMAAASVHVMEMTLEDYQAVTQTQLSHINVGSGIDCTIAELAATIAEVIGFNGAIEYDSTKPDGAPRKLMDSRRLTSTGWRPEYALKEGLLNAYAWYVSHLDSVRIA
ncbi:MAG: GDP-L-fucose synthase [Alcanivorax sp.]|jgi:GDP-L-fucose synthase